MLSDSFFKIPNLKRLYVINLLISSKEILKNTYYLNLNLYLNSY